MIRVGITGNIGSGKSVVCKIFESIGIPVFYSDDETKRLYLKPSIKQQVVKRFGEEVYFGDGRLNRKLLSYLLFKNDEALGLVESILYPALDEEFDKWAERQASKYVLFESAILFEKSMTSKFDKTIFVSAPESIRITRTMKRDECSEENVRMRMRLQWDESVKARKSDFVINNDGSEMLIPQVLLIDKKIAVNPFR